MDVQWVCFSSIVEEDRKKETLKGGYGQLAISNYKKK